MARSHPIMALAASLPLLLASLPAKAAQPAGPAPAATPATPATTPASTPASTPTPTPQPAATAATAKADTKPLPATRPGGYRLRNIKGEMAYCRTVTPIGTTLPKQECLAPDALDELLKHGQDQADSLTQHMGICGGASSACVAN